MCSFPGEIRRRRNQNCIPNKHRIRFAYGKIVRTDFNAVEDKVFLALLGLCERSCEYDIYGMFSLSTLSQLMAGVACGKSGNFEIDC
jgi:hypothetical protein